ncbi:MAG: hypothetical protein AAF676_17300 [Pseudomonadota bacterium]
MADASGLDDGTIEELRRLDPRGLMADAYAIEGIVAEACRSIFLDWALGRTEAEGEPGALRRLHEIYAPRHPGHPMTGVLEEGLSDARPRRGRRAKGRAAD